MTTQSKSSIEQLFNIAQAVSHEVINLPDSEVLNEVINDPSTKKLGIMAKNAYLKALQTVNSKEVNESEPKAISFNLASTLIKGMNVNVARQKLIGLTAMNDPSMQLIANKANALTDDEVLQTYQKLLTSGILKSVSDTKDKQ